MEALLFGAAIAALVGVLIADSKGRGKLEGCSLGCLLGPIGWLIEALLPSKEEKEDTVATAPTSQRQAAPSAAGNASGASDESEWSRRRRKCPHCAEIILFEANVCKHCGRDVGPATEEDEVRPCLYCDAPISVTVEECPECLVHQPFK